MSHFLKQAKLLFGKKERRQNRPKRQFVDQIISGIMKSYPERTREEVAIDVTYTIESFKDYYFSLQKENPSFGSDEFFNIMFKDE